ncbi:hypothetical protein [Peribacillus simplex]
MAISVEEEKSKALFNRVYFKEVTIKKSSSTIKTTKRKPEAFSL